MVEIDYATTDQQPARAWKVVAAFGIGDVFAGTLGNLAYEHFVNKYSGDDSLEILIFAQLLLLAFAMVALGAKAGFMVWRGKQAIAYAPLIALLCGVAYGLIPVIGFLQEDWGPQDGLTELLLIIMALAIPIILPIWLFSRRSCHVSTA
jgi:hypothetical protein